MKQSQPVIAEARLMRQVPTAAEQALWQILRGRGFRGLKFRRMDPVAGQMAAFACREARLILDLRPGLLVTGNDTARVAAFQAEGWRVLSLVEADVLAGPRAVLHRLLPE